MPKQAVQTVQHTSSDHVVLAQLHSPASPAGSINSSRRLQNLAVRYSEVSCNYFHLECLACLIEVGSPLTLDGRGKKTPATRQTDFGLLSRWIADCSLGQHVQQEIIGTRWLQDMPAAEI